MKTDLNIAYGTHDLQQADMYVPDTPNGAAIVFIHGGAWIRGDKAADAAIGSYFAGAGYVCAIPNYRLAPADRFPAAQDDIAAFLAWFDQSAYAFDRDRVGILGASVGGTMAITASLTGGQPAVSWSAIVDFANWVQAHQAVHPALDAANELGLTDVHAIRASFYKYFLQTYLGDLSATKLTAVSPMTHLSDTLGPTLMYNATDELVPLPGVFRFLEQAAAFGRDVSVHVVPGTAHARDYTDFALPGTRQFFDFYLGVVAD